MEIYQHSQLGVVGLNEHLSSLEVMESLQVLQWER
jgi:hypothetical protein